MGKRVYTDSVPFPSLPIKDHPATVYRPFPAPSSPYLLFFYIKKGPQDSSLSVKIQAPSPSSDPSLPRIHRALPFLSLSLSLQSPTILFPKSGLFPLSFDRILPIPGPILPIRALIVRSGGILGFLGRLGLGIGGRRGEMDSEDDMHDANDLESLEDDFYSGETAMGSDDGDADYDFVDNESDDSEDITSHRLQQNYTVLSEADIQQRQDEDINRVSTVLSISRSAAFILLRHYNWSVSKVHDEWFADEENVRKVVGVLENPMEMLNARELTCGICFENYPRNNMSAAACGHHFCGACWRGYITTSISDGPGCLMLRCPDPSCGAAVGQDMINVLAMDEDKEKYSRYFLRSYIEDNRKTKWCPAPGCEFAVEFVMGSGNYDVCCNCSYNFCWNCTEEAHRPVDCGTVAKWILKNSAESENMNWILANSKPCPKCKRPIEKNQGCMHITCTPPCKFEFCWLCLGTWSEHGERTGGFYACNRYEAAKQEGVYDESERRREMAKNSLERYTHYYERWATNQSSRQKALSDLHSMQSEKLEKLSDRQSQPESQLKFIIEAWLQIVECRRVLKWTYAYGYYLPEHEHAKRQFFEYLQGEAESGLERLHQCAEKDLQVYLDAETPMKDFNDFRTKLAGLTSVTRNYFENLVRALETGLKDVGSSNSQATCSKTSSSKNLGAKSKSGKIKVAGTSSRSGGPSRSLDESNLWSCDHCTFANPRSTNTCQMCEHHR